MKKTILIIDDEPDIRLLVKYNLEKEGYIVLEAENGKRGVEIAAESNPDLILLDVMMPEMDGIETCEMLKNIPELKGTMICFLTARGEDYSQIAGFEAGADDYITKPVKPKLLISRISAILRRQESGGGKAASEQGEKAVEKELEIDQERYLVYLRGKEVYLPRKEFELLSLLMSKPGKVFHRDEIMSRVWGVEVIVGDRTIDVHIRKLREKIGERFIKTVKGVGYKFEE
ncbi:MAG: response regulator transcription factor [Flavobacteriales bacterium]|jgi:two-component system alkaline phosphatase synthesis response regulator PhoP|nr:response regulator transcription factor [Flavobacteriales bacterium]